MLIVSLVIWEEKDNINIDINNLCEIYTYIPRKSLTLFLKMKWIRNLSLFLVYTIKILLTDDICDSSVFFNSDIFLNTVLRWLVIYATIITIMNFLKCHFIGTYNVLFFFVYSRGVYP